MGIFITQMGASSALVVKLVIAGTLNRPMPSALLVALTCGFKEDREPSPFGVDMSATVFLLIPRLSNPN
jgi:hypothetical protein